MNDFDRTEVYLLTKLRDAKSDLHKQKLSRLIQLNREARTVFLAVHVGLVP